MKKQYKIKDLSGQKFHRWTVECRVNPPEHVRNKDFPYWKCKCDCGAISTVRGANLTHKLSRGCRSCSMKESIARRANVGKKV